MAGHLLSEYQLGVAYLWVLKNSGLNAEGDGHFIYLSSRAVQAAGLIRTG